MKKPNEALLQNFKFEGAFRKIEINTSGHINGTFQLTYQLPNGTYKNIFYKELIRRYSQSLWN